MIRARTLGRNRKWRHESQSSVKSQALSARVKSKAAAMGSSLHPESPHSEGEDCTVSACEVLERATGSDASEESSSLSQSEAVVSYTASLQRVDREDVEKIGQWYFYNQLQGADCTSFRQAENHWTNGLWGMAQVNQPMLAAISAFAIHKQVTLARVRDESVYLDHKGRTIWQISKDLCTPRNSPDPLTMVAIALLAYMDVRDGKFDAAKIHLCAICKLVDFSQLPTYVWLYCVWIDLRYALLTADQPILPYHIPPSLRRHRSTRSTETVHMASENTSQCPQSDLFTYDAAFGLFEKLHTLCFLPTQLGDTDTPPFGQIYDIEYTLRIIQSEAPKHTLQDVSLAIELVVLTIQLHVWMACRFWTPQRRESHMAVHARALAILDDFGDITSRWINFAGLPSLLWVLFTVIASDMVQGDIRSGRVLDQLQSVLILLDLRCQIDFGAELAMWPWTQDWHPVHVGKVWAALANHCGDPEVQVAETQGIKPSSNQSKPQGRLFLGGLEFYGGN